MKIVIAGASGFIGQALVRHFGPENCIKLTRYPNEGEYYWEPREGILDPAVIANADVVINLCGESVVGRWTQEKMDLIRQSRLEATKLLVDRLQGHPPKVYIGASAIGYYGADRGDEELTEESQSGHGYLAEVCREWEACHLALKGSRILIPRFGVVLGREGGALAKMLPPFKLCLGGRLGLGNQWMSWVAIQEVCSIFQFCMDHPDFEGAFNVTAPNPVTNREWTKCLGQVLHRPTPFPVPSFVLKWLMGEGAEVMLGSLKVFPSRLIKAGYAFHYPNILESIASLLRPASA